MARSYNIHNEDQFRSLIGRLEAYIGQVPLRITVSEWRPTRTLEQNDKMWAVLTDLSKQVEWYGEKLSKEDWKTNITAALKGQRTGIGIDHRVVVYGEPTSKMSIKQMSDVIEAAHAFGAEHNVVWGDHTGEG